MASDARAVVPRFGGGAFTLETDGGLLRHDRHGAFTGRATTELRSLANANAFVCGVVDGGIGCFRDTHEDLTCAARPFTPQIQLFDAPTVRAVQGNPERSRGEVIFTLSGD